MSDLKPPDDNDLVRETVEIAAVNRDPVNALLEDKKVILDSKGHGLGIRVEIDQSVIDKFEQVASFYRSTSEVELERFSAYLVSCTYDLLELFSSIGFSSDIDNPHRIRIFFGGSTTGELDKKIFNERRITGVVLMRAEVENLKPFPVMFKLARGFYISQQLRTQSSPEEQALPLIHVSNYVLDIIGLLACKTKFFEFEEKGVPRYKKHQKTGRSSKKIY